MFNVALNSHPKTICNKFKKTENFNRSLEIATDKVKYRYLQDNIPVSGIRTWKNLKTKT